VHVASWRETYTGMLPQALVERNTDERRRGGAMPESIRGRPPIPGHDAYVDALVLAASHGHGAGRGFRSLALHVVAPIPAREFYERLGARFLGAEPFADGVDEGVQIAYGWSDMSELANRRNHRS
jgi:hypothetical protein